MRYYTTIVLFLFLFSNLKGQNISANDSSGCAPFTVNFTANQPGQWVFGNGSSSSNQNASTVYSNPGNYNAIFIKDSDKSQDTIPITVYGNPAAQFSAADSSGCFPFSTSFNDLSTAQGSSNIVKWEWTFGDGGGANTQNPSYTYTFSGKYKVSLKVTDDKGCINLIEKDQFISASNPPTASFTGTPLTSCTAPLNVTLTNTSTNSSGGTSGLTYLWDFGNGNTSTSKDPTANYTTDGAYTIKLTVNQDGCIRTATRSVSIGNPLAIINGPDSVCQGVSTTLSNGTAGSFNWKWELNGTQFSTAKNPTFTFNNAGNNTLKLTATSTQGCSDDTTITLFVQDLNADFTPNPTYFCKNTNPYCVNFTDGTTSNGPITTWDWQFGDGGISSQQNPNHCYYTDTNIYTVHDPYVFLTTLTVYSNIGCRSRIVKSDTIYPISAFFSPDVSQGCAPLTVTFSDSTRSRETVKTWLYDFGDGNSSTSQNPSHTYTKPGVYTVTLQAENTLGCRDTSYEVQIYVGDNVNIDFNISKNSICPGDTVYFTNNTSDPLLDSVDYWHYQTDNAPSNFECYDQANQSWAYYDKVGQYDVTQYASFNGCVSSKTYSNAITVNGPTSKFFYTGDCKTPFKYDFDADVQGATSFKWDFGDGTTMTTSDLNDTTLSHTYVATGDYNVILISENNSSGCKNDTDTMLIHVRDLKASILGDSVICSGLSYTFTAGTSQDVHSSCGNGYHWDLGAKTPPRLTADTSMTFYFNNPTKDTIRLIVYDINHCRDTLEYPIRVTGITAKIGYDTLSGCLPLNINFSDKSTSDTLINKWEWYHHHLKDYSWQSIGNTQNLAHTFTGSESFPDTVIMVVTDALGCSDSDSVVVNPIIPDSTFYGKPDLTICAGDSVQFYAKDSAAQSTWVWEINNGIGIVNGKNPYVTFANSDTFDVKLTVTDTNGCIATMTRSNYVRVQAYPKVGFNVFNDQGENVDTLPLICYGQKMTFVDTSIANVFQSRTWDIGTGGQVVPNQTVFQTYNAPGTYNVELIVRTTYGCVDTAKKAITFVGPVAKISMSDSLICLGDEVTFTMKDTADVFKFTWDLGDGTTDSINNPVKHSYSSLPYQGKTLIQLIVEAPISSGVSCSYVVKDTLNVHQVQAGFSLTDSVYCDGDQIAVTDTSIGAVNYFYDFGNGTTFNSSNTTPVKYSVGNYTIIQAISDPVSGCSDTAKANIWVAPLPNVSVNNASFCSGGKALLIAKGAKTYTWAPNNELNKSTGDTVEITPAQTTTIIVTGTDSNGCVSNANALVAVMQPVPTTTFDTCVIIGMPVNIGKPSSPIFSYDWTKGETNWLNCTNCSDNQLQVTEEVDTLKYHLIFTDSIGCYVNHAYYNVCIKPSYTFDVPTAFTPDGDNVNDKAFVEGHGIKQLVSFKIYNRWGEVVFETNDINQGWDGVYKGELQSIESFVWKATVEFYNGKQASKAGTLTILR